MSLWASNDKLAREMSPALLFSGIQIWACLDGLNTDGPIKPLQKCQVIINQISGDIIKWKDIELNRETYFCVHASKYYWAKRH